MTNYQTTQQKRDICDEDPSIKDAMCKNDTDCLNRDFTRWNGKLKNLLKISYYLKCYTK